jgi:hypothetical protein
VLSRSQRVHFRFVEVPDLGIPECAIEVSSARQAAVAGSLRGSPSPTMNSIAFTTFWDRPRQLAGLFNVTGSSWRPRLRLRARF